jgi:NADP-dependent 3-hydroxy acid dehydrogenase YdfG
MSVTPDLKGQTAVVTGASSGIGRAIALRLGECGAHVILSGRTESTMRETADAIANAGGRATVKVADVRDPEAMAELAATALTMDGRLDIFVNNAGVAWLSPIIDGDVEHWRAMLDTNVLALLVGCQAAIRAMRSTGSAGRIINVSSVAAQDRASGVYGATKHAVNVITQTLRDELAEDSIQLCSIMPGLVATNIGRNHNPEVIAGIVAVSGVNTKFVPGEHLSNEVLEKGQAALSDFMMSPDDIADAVAYVVGLPMSVNITDLALRPPKGFEL